VPNYQHGKSISGLPSALQNGNDPVFDMVVGQKWRSIKRPNSVGFSLTLSSSIPTASCSAVYKRENGVKLAF
jgi:hypothetical protein